MPVQRMESPDATAALGSALAVNITAALSKQAAGGRRKNLTLLFGAFKHSAAAGGECLIYIRSVGQTLLQAVGLSRRNLVCLL